MALISRKKRPLDRSVDHYHDTRLVIIATEGRCTEAQYFSMFRDSRIQVKVLPTGEDNKSSPQHVLDRLREYRGIYELGEDDELWLMVDVDRWGEANLSKVAKEAQDCGFGLAVSNPCFEVWLLFHHTDLIGETSQCCEVEEWLRAELGGSYNKSRLILEQYSPHVMQALQRAVATDNHPRQRWPKQTGTHVYRVVRKLPAN